MSDQTPPVIERRRNAHGSSEVLELVRLIHDSQKDLQASQRDLDKKLTQHLTEEPIQLAEEIAGLLVKCFPGGDGQSHRAYHEALIGKAQESHDFWRDMRKKLGEWGLVGFLGWSVYALWNAFLQGPHK